VTKAAVFNREVWNERQFDKIPVYFAEDFVSEPGSGLAIQHQISAGDCPVRPRPAGNV